MKKEVGGAKKLHPGKFDKLKLPPAVRPAVIPARSSWERRSGSFPLLVSPMDILLFTGWRFNSWPVFSDFVGPISLSHKFFLHGCTKETQILLRGLGIITIEYLGEKPRFRPYHNYENPEVIGRRNLDSS